MGKSKKSRSKTDNSEQYIITARNLARKGKTNKKLKLNPLASKYESSENTKLKEKVEKTEVYYAQIEELQKEVAELKAEIEEEPEKEIRTATAQYVYRAK